LRKNPQNEKNLRTRKETEIFFDKMTGFEKYVYDNLPKNKGYLFI
jgi:hypothetical protein